MSDDGCRNLVTGGKLDQALERFQQQGQDQAVGWLPGAIGEDERAALELGYAVRSIDAIQHPQVVAGLGSAGVSGRLASMRWRANGSAPSR
ncbi:hypothetical protein ACFQS6_09285 [Xanthomonas populi]|uniref:hypothetical protein n=1 Tax=Xanthomonas populi TaxID=53414 RepID=UPI001ABF83B7|nr:hypothetical protein [Xanthomonas populi]